MDWQWIPAALPLLISAAVLLALVPYSWRYRRDAKVATFILLLVAAVIWLLGSALFLLSTTPITRRFWGNVRMSGTLITGTAWLAFVLQYTGHGPFLRRPRNLPLVVTVPLITLWLIWTDSPLFYGLSAVGMQAQTGRLALVGPWFWINTVYMYALLFVSTLVLLRAYRSQAHGERRQTSMLLACIALLWLGSGLSFLKVRLFSLNLPPFAAALAGLIVAWGLFRYRLLGIVPAAHAAVIDSMSDGVLVLDAGDRVTDMNPANASKFSPRGSTVEFGLECQNSQAIFRISDHGIGIPAEDQPRLFDSFQRGTNVGHIPGTGLGLSIVKRSVDLHGGTITFASQVNVGTTFTVTLPLRLSAGEEVKE